MTRFVEMADGSSVEVEPVEPREVVHGEVAAMSSDEAIPLRVADFGDGAFRLFELRLSRKAAESVRATVESHDRMLEMLRDLINDGTVSMSPAKRRAARALVAKAEGGS